MLSIAYLPCARLHGSCCLMPWACDLASCPPCHAAGMHARPTPCCLPLLPHFRLACTGPPTQAGVVLHRVARAAAVQEPSAAAGRSGAAADAGPPRPRPYAHAAQVRAGCVCPLPHTLPHGGLETGARVRFCACACVLVSAFVRANCWVRMRPSWSVWVSILAPAS